MKKSDKIFSVESPDDSTGFLLWQVTNLWQREIRKALEAYDLTHSQFVLLASILWLSSKKKVNITQVLLSEHTKIDPMTTSTVLRKLQRKGLIQRKENETDTRAKTVDLTSEGSKVAAMAVKTVEKFDAEFFSTLKENQKKFNNKLNLLLNQIN
jgi:MarR family transcriptional regulator, organic hydroperoxide resistance regulator